MVFWITASALATAVSAFLVLTLLRARADGEHPAAYDLRVYRDQLKEVDRDLARGVIGPDDAERIRAEVGRRVLAADAQLQQVQSGADQPRSATVVLGALVALALIGGTLALYPVLGSPGARDLPLKGRIARSNETRATRPSQSIAETDLPTPSLKTPAPEFAALMVKLRKTVAERPDDLEGHVLLARNEASLGNHKAAYDAQQSVIRIKGDTATATDYSLLAELMINAANGYVSPEAEEALRAALERDPGNQPARYYTGLMLIQIDRPDQAFRFWRRLLEEGPPSAPWNQVIRDQITELAWRAGVDYTPPAPQSTTAGPTQQDIENASQMTPEERSNMIRGMVSRLNERLATEGGSPQEWAQLIAGLGILGNSQQAAAIWGEAQQIFASEPAALDIVRAGAIRAGVADAPAGQLPPDGGLSGPTREDMQNAAEMTPEERQQMIRGMISQLSERLSSDGGSPQEWARLITSQAKFGNPEAAQQAWADARAAYADDDGALGHIDAAADSVGLNE